MKRILNLTRGFAANPFLAGSAVMLVGTNLHNFGQLLFHFLAGRLLGASYYADVASIISVLGLISIVQLSLGLTIVKFISSSEDKAHVINLCKWLYHWSFRIGLVIALIFLVITPFLSDFLNIHQKNAVYLLGPSLLLFMMINTGRSILQGLLKFNSFVISMIIEVSVKILLAIPLIIAGYAVFGVMVALFISALTALFVVNTTLSEYLKGKKQEMPNFAPLIKYSIPVFVQGLALTSMYSTDLILVKHFFPGQDAGIYASLAKLGSIVFFGASPIAHVMFPLVSKRFSKNEPYKNLFYLSLAFVSGAALSIVLFYRFFSSFILNLLYGQEYLEGAPLLWWFGSFMGLLAVSMLFTQFYLSIGKTKVVWLFAAASLLQALLIWFYHDTLLQVIQISISSAALLVVSLFVYFLYLERKK